MEPSDRPHREIMEVQALRAMRSRFGDEASSGRKTLKIKKGKLPTDADLVVTLRYRGGIAFYLSDERRWVVSYPQQHYARGVSGFRFWVDIAPRR